MNKFYLGQYFVLIQAFRLFQLISQKTKSEDIGMDMLCDFLQVLYDKRD